MSVAPKLSAGCVYRKIFIKERLQKVVFPKGIICNFQNQTFQTISVNEAFEAIKGVNSVPGDDKKQDDIKPSCPGMSGGQNYFLKPQKISLSKSSKFKRALSHYLSHCTAK